MTDPTPASLAMTPMDRILRRSSRPSHESQQFYKLSTITQAAVDSKIDALIHELDLIRRIALAEISAELLIGP